MLKAQLSKKMKAFEKRMLEKYKTREPSKEEMKELNDLIKEIEAANTLELEKEKALDPQTRKN